MPWELKKGRSTVKVTEETLLFYKKVLQRKCITINHVASSFENQDRKLYLKGDTGASKHFLKETDKDHLLGLKQILDGPIAILPNNSRIQPMYEGEIQLPEKLSDRARKALVYPEISNDSLLSIGQLFDDDCIAVFTNKRVLIFKNNKMILEGKRNKKDGLWDVPVKTKNFKSKYLKVNYIIQRKKSKHDLAHYLHRCAMSPKISTFQAAIGRGNFVTWPGIDNINFKNIIRTTEATEKGHMDQELQGLQSTKKIEDEEDDAFPNKIKEKTLVCLATVTRLPKEKKETAYID